MDVTRAALIARHTLPAALETMTRAAAWLRAHDCAVVVEAGSAEAAALDDSWPRVDRTQIADGVNAVIAFGGDGTLLDAASAVAHSPHDVPVIGINLGRLGFLTEVARDDLISALDALRAGRFTVETRLLLHGSVRHADGRTTDHLALNDVVVTRGALSRMIEVQVAVDGQDVCVVKADGVIVATATGSTAYNLSAGGPIVHPSVDALVLTPIAPHTLTLRPIVLPAGSTIALAPIVDAQAELVLTFDGQFGVSLSDGDRIVITRAARVLRLLRIAQRTHFDMLRQKLKWG